MGFKAKRIAGQPRVEKIHVSFRLSEESIAQLDHLASAYGLSHTRVIEALIHVEFDSLQSDTTASIIARVRNDLDRLNLLVPHNVSQTSHNVPHPTAQRAAFNAHQAAKKPPTAAITGVSKPAPTLPVTRYPTHWRKAVTSGAREQYFEPDE